MIQEKSIMIFGAGVNQLELIRAAREMSIVSVVLDPSFDAPGKSIADVFYKVEASDYDQTKNIALKHRVDGIVTGQMEKPMRLMAKLALDLGFIFHSPDVVDRSLDKWKMKETFLSAEVPCAKGFLIESNRDTAELIKNNLDFPVIIKPRDSFSSRGVIKIDSISELITSISESRFYSSNGDIIAEEFLDGREFSIESITYKGKTTIIQFTEKFITPYPRTVEIGHLQPANLTVKEKEEISKVVINGINALGIDNSASHSEIMLTSTGAKIIEIGARLGGDFISSYLTKASVGVNMDKAAICTALGLQPDLKKNFSKFSYIRYLEIKPGKKIKKVLPTDDLLKLPGVVFAWVFVKPSDVIQPVNHSALRPACIMVEADTREQVIKLVFKYLEELNKLIITN